jgi:hypothetical protein
MKNPKAQTKAYRIRRYLFSHPAATAKEVAKALGTTEAYVYVVQSKERKMVKKEAAKLKENWAAEQASLPITGKSMMQAAEPLKKPQAWETVHVSVSDTPLPVTMEEPAADLVNHPAHYKVGGIETIDFIEAKGLNYNTGNAVKYITRADHKGNRKQDLEKAVWYLNREISHMQGA